MPIYNKTERTSGRYVNIDTNRQSDKRKTNRQTYQQKSEIKTYKQNLQDLITNNPITRPSDRHTNRQSDRMTYRNTNR